MTREPNEAHSPHHGYGHVGHLHHFQTSFIHLRTQRNLISAIPFPLAPMTACVVRRRVDSISAKHVVTGNLFRRQ
jgi:hypothetical protein